MRSIKMLLVMLVSFVLAFSGSSITKSAVLERSN